MMHHYSKSQLLMLPFDVALLNAALFNDALFAAALFDDELF